MTLLEFLLARIAEDEAVARAAVYYPEKNQREQRLKADPTVWHSSSYPHHIIDQARWKAELPGPAAAYDDAAWESAMDGVGVWIPGEGAAASPEVVEHLKRHGPARVLAECESKRRLIALHHDDGRGDCVGCGFGSDEERMNTVEDCPTLRLLALPYVDHPDYPYIKREDKE